jgi:hypothetical protein
MKKHLFALLGLGLLLASAPVYAQTITLKADVPFDFVVNGHTLPSGEYTIRSANSSGRVLSLSGAEKGKKRLLFFVANTCRSNTTSEQSKLVFIHDRDGYSLSEMWVAGNTTGIQLPNSRRARQIAQNMPPQQVVVLAELR